MSKPKLTYFDSPVSRGEECRIALALAGVDFEDVRIKRDEWPGLKPKTPFGAMPFWEEAGRPPLAQSNAILSLIGRRHDLLPKDEYAAAQHEALMEHAEDLRHKVFPTLRITDDAEKKKAREALATDTIPTWATFAEKQLGEGPFVGGKDIGVADVKLYMLMRWFRRGTVDHIPKTIFDRHPKLVRLYDAVEANPRVAAWIAKN